MEWANLGQCIFFGLTTGGAYALFALGLSLIFGVIGVLNVAHGEFYMVGALLGWVFITELELNYAVGLFIVLVLGGVVGFIANQFAIQPLIGRPNLLLLSLLSTAGVSMVLVNSIEGIFGATTWHVNPPFTGRILLGGIQLPIERVFIFIIAITMVILLQLFLAKTTLGKALRAVAENNIGAMLVGIHLKRVYALGSVISGALAALSGLLLLSVWYGSPYMGSFILIKGFAIVILAGLGSVMGAVWVGIGVGVVEALFGNYVSVYFREAFVFGVMIVMLLLKPRGIFAKA